MATTFSAQIRREPFNVLQYFPLINSPAVKPNEYAEDDLLLLARNISGVALSYIAMAALCWICPPLGSFATKYTIRTLLFCALPFVPGLIEIGRAAVTANQLAVANYLTPTPSSKATDRLCKRPSAFQHILREDLNKLDDQGTSLVSKIFSVWTATSGVCRMFIDSGVDLLAVNEKGVSPFMLAMESSDPSILEYILKSKKVEAANISEEDQVAIWKRAKDAKTILLLHRYGFNIDARDAERSTPLMHWAKKSELHLCLSALNLGANPLLENSQGAKASQIVPIKSLLQPLLQQAEREFGKDLPPLPKEKGLMAWLPWRAFTQRDRFSYTADSDALMNRSLAMIIAGMTLMFFAPRSMTLMAAMTSMSVSLISIPVSLIGLWRGTKEANRQAVVAHLASLVPSRQSTSTICKSVDAARLLIEHGPNLNKLDEEGETLLGKLRVDPNVFKLLVDSGADIFAGHKQSGFFHAVKDSSPELLAYILDRRQINIEEMPKELQVQMWRSVGSEQTARFLKQYGFNPDVRDFEGNTPLMLLAKQGFFVFNSPTAKINALLAVGADTLLTNNDGKTAKELAANPWIEKLFLPKQEV